MCGAEVWWRQTKTHVMEEELTCALCSELYTSGTREPIVLPLCGHAFCRQCLKSLESDAGILVCPTCRTLHQGATVACLPTVFALLNLSENYRKCEEGGQCVHHGSSLEFWCSCCEMALCGHCLLEGHLQDGHRVKKAKIFMGEKKQEIKSRGDELIHTIHGRRKCVINNVINFVRQVTRHAEESRLLSTSEQKVEAILRDTGGVHNVEAVLMSSTLMESLEGDVQRILGQQQPQITDDGVPRSKYCGEVQTAHLSISDVEWPETPPSDGTEQLPIPENQSQGSLGKDLIPGPSRAGANEGGGGEGEVADGEGVDESVKACTTPWPLRCCVVHGEGRVGHLRWEQDQLHLYALTDQPNDAHLMVQMSLLQSLTSVERPEVFLDLGVEGRSLGRVYIRLEGQCRRAQHFLALCLGTLGPSFQGSKFHGVGKRGSPGETLAGGKYITPKGTSVQGLMKDLEWGGRYMRDKTEGLVVGASGGKPELDAYFHICTRDHKGKRFACAFGQVVVGMEVVHEAVKHVTITDVVIVRTGVVLPA
ncbi:Tripartite motif-containing protein 59-like 2 [Homarus americanus]|uniref:Tripartite motif-containing protein 59-like 2 n=1 Tax=Homarus americanus TaxID=6706 RepID=A0A8J5JHE6_HOMAM|nr:Tripartite motif-containing protein 59-like 2 [Homarus americanus]